MNQEHFTIDEARRFGLKIAQPRKGYRFSIDPLLLADFAAKIEGVRAIADLGTGSGIIPMILCRVYSEACATGFESNPDMAGLAKHNVEFNDLSKRINVVSDDIIHHKRHFPACSFDLVVSNPPFRTAISGHISPFKGRDTARHESTAGLSEFLSAAKYLVRESGRICFIYHPSRLGEFIQAAGRLKLNLLRLRMVHNMIDAPASIFLAELAKDSRAHCNVMAPLIIRNPTGDYTSEAAKVIN